MNNQRKFSYKTPRLLTADAYTVGSDIFQSVKAKEKSTYYITFRRRLVDINPNLYTEGDNRIIFAGISRIVEELFFEPITHEEIDETLNFLKTFRVGNRPYEFNEKMWRDIVREFDGKLPIKITALPECSVCYPNEPIVQIESLQEGYGELAAWFESKLLHVWAASERVTQNQHWLKYLKSIVQTVQPELSNEERTFLASLMLTDFGDRAAICQQESEILGMYHLLTFPGTDTCSGAYQAWKIDNCTTQYGSSVKALAHRNVQAFDLENDCYETLYNCAEDGEILSMVADCYDFKNAVENMLLPLALKSKELKNGKIIVARPDSGDALEQVLWICDLAVQNGLYETIETSSGTWKKMTYLKFIEGDGMSFKAMKEIIQALLDKGFAPHLCGLFGVGGGLRNNLKRDNLSAKYALSSVSNECEGRVKFSENPEKTTLPGPFKLLRDIDSLNNKITIVHKDEPGMCALITYYDTGIVDNNLTNYPFSEWKNRLDLFDSFPLTLEREHTNYPASENLLNKRNELLQKYKK